MPRVHRQKAAKDYPSHGIKKGDIYYSWKFRYGGKFMSKEPPKPSQLTQSKLSGVYAAQEALEEAVAAATTPADVAEALQACAEDVRAVAEEYRDSISNMPEGLQQGPVAEDMEDKASQLDDFADELDSAASDVENLDPKDYVDQEFRRQAIFDRLEEEADEGAEVDEEQVDNLLDAEVESIDSFEDLLVGEQESMMEEARSKAGEPECPL